MSLDRRLTPQFSVCLKEIDENQFQGPSTVDNAGGRRRRAPPRGPDASDDGIRDERRRSALLPRRRRLNNRRRRRRQAEASFTAETATAALRRFDALATATSPPTAEAATEMAIVSLELSLWMTALSSQAIRRSQTTPSRY